MKTKLTLLALALGASTCLLTAQDGPPPSDTQRPPQREGGPGGPGGQRGFHLLPPRAQEQLNLTDEQNKQIAALEAETKAKLEKILTADQLEQLKNLRPPMRPGGPGGQGDPQMRGGPNGPGKNFRGNGNNRPPGPPPGEGDGNNRPPGPPPGDQ